MYLHEKADYELLRKELDIEWVKYLSDTTNIEEMWNKFKSKLKNVPTRKIRNLIQYRKRTNENLPMNKKL